LLEIFLCWLYTHGKDKGITVELKILASFNTPIVTTLATKEILTLALEHFKRYP